MRKDFVFAAFMIFVAVLISLPLQACGEGGSESVMENASVKPEEFLPFKVTTFKGQTVELEKLRGRVVVVNFWASWCGPCKMEARELEAVYKKYKEKGVEFVGIAVDDTDGAARAFIKEYNVTYPNAIDSDNSISIRYQIFAIPTTFVLDKDAVIRYKRQGAIMREALSGEIKKLL